MGHYLSEMRGAEEDDRDAFMARVQDLRDELRTMSLSKFLVEDFEALFRIMGPGHFDDQPRLADVEQLEARLRRLWLDAALSES